jgi:uncharacterized protein (TIGR01777 family)
MNTYLLALELMVLQGILGAFDTVYHHEITESLPQKNSARLELSIHSARALIYSVMFVGLSAWQWNGTWALVLMALFGIEIILTLWDFVIEDKTRLLPATERVTHTILAINAGAFMALLAINAPQQMAQPTGLVWDPYGFVSVFLFLCGIGVGLSGIRDFIAVLNIGKINRRDKALLPVSFSETTEHVLVTGATGFIGQKLVAALLADGQQVTVLTRDLKKAAWMFDGQVRCISQMSDLPVTHKIDVIINLAGARILGWRWSSKRKRVLRDSRISLTEKVVQWIGHAEQKPRLLISASAIGYYGIQQQDDDRVLTENSPSSSIFMSQLCQDWEGAAQAASEYGVNVKCMRFGLVLGHQGALPMMLLPIKLGLGGPLGGGKQWLSWIHVHDLLRGIGHIWQSSSQDNAEQVGYEVYNFTAPEAVMQKQFSKIAGEVLHRPNVFSTPGAPMRFALGEQSDLLLEGQRVGSERLTAEGFCFTFPDVRSALKSLY